MKIILIIEKQMLKTYMIMLEALLISLMQPHGKQEEKIMQGKLLPDKLLAM